jgi:nucleoside-diphosphate kinase
MTDEKTLVILKPDCVNRGLIGEIVHRFECKGLKIVGLKMEVLKPETLHEHYGHHAAKPFFPGLVKFMTSIPCVLMVLEGKESVKVVRKMAGVTSGREAEFGTIRGDFSLSVQTNIVHVSEDKAAAAVEIKRFFKPHEIHSYKKPDFEWIYGEDERK